MIKNAQAALVNASAHIWDTTIDLKIARETANATGSSEAADQVEQLLVELIGSIIHSTSASLRTVSTLMPVDETVIDPWMAYIKSMHEFYVITEYAAGVVNGQWPREFSDK
jgi:hypothetical protein